MNLPRYIVLKPKDFDTEPEEQEDYERKSDFFVTSQTTCPPDDFEPGDLAHVRFGVDNFFPQNYSVVDWDEQEWGVPVHDSCWKIFERVSKMRLGEVDLQGFMALWTVSAVFLSGEEMLSTLTETSMRKLRLPEHEARSRYCKVPRAILDSPPRYRISSSKSS